MKFVGQGFQKLEAEQDTQRHTDAPERIITFAFAGDKTGTKLPSKNPVERKWSQKSPANVERGGVLIWSRTRRRNAWPIHHVSAASRADKRSVAVAKA